VTDYQAQVATMEAKIESGSSSQPARIRTGTVARPACHRVPLPCPYRAELSDKDAGCYAAVLEEA
jgi:hypothetical protein